ncbi:hypothetical protein BDV12DRAFT_185208 [Aspergillus spectabilis]
MSALQSKVYRLETQLAELHQRINDNVNLDTRERAGRISPPIERLTILENTISQLSLNSKSNNTLRSDQLVRVISKSRDELSAAVDPLESDVLTYHLSDLSWLASAKASIHTLATVLNVFSENVILLDEEIRYWESVLEFDWCIGLYALQISPSRVWRKYTQTGHPDSKELRPGHTGGELAAVASSNPDIWSRFYSSVRRCIISSGLSFRVGLSPFLGRSRLEIQQKKKKLKAMRDFNASAIGLLVEECLSLEANIHTADSSRKFTNDSLRRCVLANVNLMKSILRSDGKENDIFELAKKIVANGDDVPCKAQGLAEIKLTDNSDILLELILILTDLLPRYRSSLIEGIIESGRPSPAVRYWLPFSLTLISATPVLKIAENVGPVLIDSISNLVPTAIEFWKNWVVDPTLKLIRTIRHDEKSGIPLEAERASLERMVVDFVLSRGDQDQHASADIIVDKVRGGDLTPVLRAYEKDIQNPFMSTVRGDLVRAFLIQIQKTKVDVNAAYALLKSQELVLRVVALTPGLLVSYVLLQWMFGLLGNRRGFRMGKKQNDLRYALRNIHRILSTSSLSKSGRLSYRDHGLLICNAEILLDKARSILKGEDLHAFQDDISDLVNEYGADKQLRVAERMVWTYSKWN